jgi:hypothetical protein
VVSREVRTVMERSADIVETPDERAGLPPERLDVEHEKEEEMGNWKEIPNGLWL